MNYQDMKKIYIKPQSAIYTLEAATMLAGSLDGQKINMDSDPQYDGNASLSNKRENPIWNNSLLSND
jgi:hypothetical protein